MNSWSQTVVVAAVVMLGALFTVAIRGWRSAPIDEQTLRTLCGKLVAIAAGLTVLALITMFPAVNPFSGPAATPATVARMSPTAISAVLACIAGLRGSGSLLVAAFAFGFFPWWIGPYLLGVPGVFRWIPIAEFGYLVAAGLLFRGWPSGTRS